jgi:hypothetical protein
MKVFDDDDAESLFNADQRIPDGIIDGTQYAEIFKNLVGHMKKIKPESYMTNITWIMSAMNECYNDDENGNGTEIDKTRATDVITALSYFVMTLITSMDEEVFEEYIRIQEEEVIPDLFQNAETIPYYDMSKEISGLLEFFDEIDELGDNETND